MQDSEKKGFADLMAGVYAYHRVAISTAVINVFWNGCRRWEFEQVQRAIDVLTADPEAGKYPPKIGDITRKVPRVNDDGEKVDTEEERKGTAWRDVPPGLKDGEKQGIRTGRNLTVRPKADGEKEASRGPEPPKTPILPTPPVKD